jgi:hypothetical protein
MSEELKKHPAHYGGEDNPYEAIKVIEAWLSPEAFIGFCRGNAIKYLSRAGKKGPAQADLFKASDYSDIEREFRDRVSFASNDQLGRERALVAATGAKTIRTLMSVIGETVNMEKDEAQAFRSEAIGHGLATLKLLDAIAAGEK